VLRSGLTERVLAFVTECPGHRSYFIASHCGTTSKYIGEVLKRLTAQGRLERRRLKSVDAWGYWPRERPASVIPLYVFRRPEDVWMQPMGQADFYVYIQVSFPTRPDAIPVYIHGPSRGLTSRIAMARAIRIVRASRAAHRSEGWISPPSSLVPIAALRQALSGPFEPKRLISLAETGLEK
jgi:hypothetical protein